MPVRSVDGVVQHYTWGDADFIPQLLGVPGRGKPWAELWLGTHPNGPTRLDDGTPLDDFTGPLPYLLKVLAAAEPLSLQAHPSADQAASGHERGVFADPHPKPELLVAVTDFEAFCGFRPYGSTVDWLRGLGVDDLADLVRDRGAETLGALYRHEIDLSATISGALADSDNAHARWTHRLGERYGMDDPSVVATLLMNHVVLRPGQALHLTAGNLHAYLRGAGIELMGASDNVVRGGLTDKDVDVDLLLEIVDPSPLRQPIMQVDDGRYPLPEAGVELVRLEAGAEHTAVGHELAVALDGTTVYLSPGTPIMTDAVTFVVTPA